MIDLDHEWAPVELADHAEPVAYVCQRCGESRPRSVAVVRPVFTDRQRTRLQQAGIRVTESPFIPAGTVLVIDGRMCPALDQTMFCMGTP